MPASASLNNFPSTTDDGGLLVQKVITSSPSRISGRRFTDQDARSAADILVFDALKKGTMDNVTVIVCLLPWN